MPRAIWKKASWRQHRLLFGALVGGCTLLLLGALLVSAHEARLHTLQLARIAAVTAIDKDMMYRNWNSGHAAVYVSVTAETPPNPYLADIPERDIVTPSGRPLTLMNPAYMTRQAMEIKNKEMGIQQHMTSLNPLRPENAADPWETETLRRFEKGATEAMAIASADGKEVLRFMQPLLTRQDCLNCHAHQGYQPGDLYGGISIDLPLAPFRLVQQKNIRFLAGVYASLWVIGLLVILIGFQSLLSREEDLEVFRLRLEQAQKLEAIGHLGAGLAHEINTPLQVIQANTQFLLGGLQAFQRAQGAQQRLLNAVRSGGETTGVALEVDAELRVLKLPYLAEEMPRAIEETLEGVGKVAKIIGAMKEFSLPVSTEWTPTDLNRAIENALTITQGEWSEVADLDLALDPLLPLIPCLPREMNLVLLSLLNNATHTIRAKQVGSPGAKGRLGISTVAKDGSVEIRVLDTGMGIPLELRHRLFEPFFTTKAVGQGTGQELARAYAVVVNHGGSLSFETNPGEGTTFVVRLPINQG